MKKVSIGTSGYKYGGWKGRFYPDGLPSKEWLSYFSQRFPTVEINNSFYVATKRETYEKWYTQTPEDFSFAVKGHRMITQYKKLIAVEEPVKQFFAHATALKEKLKVVLWQFPVSFKLTKEHKEEYLERFETFLKLLPKDIAQAIELRDTSWFCKEMFAVVHDYNVSLVYSDSPKFPLLPERVQPFSYVRFHGPEALYASSYTDEQLRNWKGKIERFNEQGDVFCYFNNDIGGHAIANAQSLQKLCDGS